MPTLTVPKAFALALQNHQAGRLGEAEAIYRQIVAVAPQHAEALRRSNLWTIAASAVGRGLLAGLVLLLGAFGQAVAETGNVGEQLHRRGYPKDVDLKWAVSDYNLVHRSDPVAKNYPELNETEIMPAISKAIMETPRTDKQKLERLASLKKFVRKGSLPKGSLLTFQFTDKNRTAYWFQWEKLSDKFSIILISGLDENPPWESGYNEEAFITGVLLRSHQRIDRVWKEMMERITDKRKRNEER